MSLDDKKTIAFLISASSANKDNVRYLVNGAIDAGFNAEIVDVNSLRIDENTKVLAHVAKVSAPLQAGYTFHEMPFERREIKPDLMWMLNRGTRHGYMDRLQILTQINDNLKIPVVNAPSAQLKYNNKYAMMMAKDYEQPLTYVDDDADRLLQKIRARPDQYFIIKPPAGSLGKGVYKLRADTENLEQIVRSSTQDAEGVPEYAVLQDCIPEIEKNGDKRVLVAGGKVIAAYARQTNNDHRTNLSQGANAAASELTLEERMLCTKLAHELRRDGCYFAGIDLCYPYVVEVNVIHPGGIATIDKLTGINNGEAVVGNVYTAAKQDMLIKNSGVSKIS